MEPVTLFHSSYDSLSLGLEEIELHINRFGHQHDTPDATCERRIIGDRELIYNVGGISIVTIGNCVHTLRAGDFILIPPFVPHMIDTASDNPHNNYWTHFDASLSPASEQLFMALEKQWGGHSFSAGLQPRLLSLYEQMEKEYNCQMPGYCAYMNLALKQIFIEMIRLCGLRFSLDTEFSQGELIFRGIVRYIHTHLCQINRVEDIAVANHISLSYLNKLFHRNMAASPTRFMMQLKMQRAEKLLRSTGQSIKSIAEQLNFSSSYHFTNTFKQYYGVSPLSYRKINFDC